MDKYSRSRNFSAVSYLEYEDIISSIKTCGKIRHYAIICHDKDIKENGELKEKHFHIVANCFNGVTVAQFRNYFYKKANTLAQPLYDKSGAFAYLTHCENPEKFQYNIEDIKSDCIEYWTNVQENDNTCNLINDIIDRVPLKDLLSRYGRDFVLHYRTYFEFADLLKKNNEYWDSVKEIKEKEGKENEKF